MKPDALPERFQTRIKINEETGCWEWLAGKRNGYGRLSYRGKEWEAHRFTYTMLVEKIPSGKEMHHTCNNRGCCNPEHLIAVTRSEHDAIEKGSHCKNGHERTPENTYNRPDGYSECVRCKLDKLREARWRKKGA